jgi:hypothetical protein
MQRSLGACRVALVLLWPAFAPAAPDPGIVPIEREPRHHVAFEDPLVRVFDTRVPGGDTTLYHRHERDSVYVLLSGTSNLVTEPLGEPPRSLSAQPGEVFFGEHSKKALVHRLANLSAEEHHVLDIELVAPRAASDRPLPALASGNAPVLENARVRVSRVLLQPGAQHSEGTALAPAGVFVILQGGRLSISGQQVAVPAADVSPGKFYTWSGAPPAIRNEGTDPVAIVEIDIK